MTTPQEHREISDVLNSRTENFVSQTIDLLTAAYPQEDPGFFIMATGTVMLKLALICLGIAGERVARALIETCVAREQKHWNRLSPSSQNSAAENALISILHNIKEKSGS